MNSSIAMVNEVTARQAVFTYASHEAEAWQAELRQFGALWRAFNDTHFGSALAEPHLMVGSPTSPKAEGEFTTVGGDGLRSLILIRRTYVDGTFNQGKVPEPGQTVRFFRIGHDPRYRWRYLADILLHEQVHQWQWQYGKPSKTKHDVEFTAKCNEIGDQLGLGRVVSRRRKGDPKSLPIAAEWPTNVRPESLPIAAEWPTNVRPEGYYGDLWEQVSAPEQVEDWLSQMLALWAAGDPPNQLTFLQHIGVTIAGTSNGAAEPVDDDDPAEPAVITSDGGPLHERVKAARIARDWSQREVAEAVGTHQSIISKLENGRSVDEPLMARILAVLESAGDRSAR